MSTITSTILSGGKQISAEYELLSLDVVKDVNRIPYAQLVLLDGDAATQRFAISDSDVFKPGQSIEIKLRYEGAPSTEATVFKGLVVALRVEASGRGSLLTVELKDAAVKLTLSRKSAVYRDQRDDQIIGQIITQSGLRKGTLTATQARHRELVQYYCADWDFIVARAEANALLVTVDDGAVSARSIAAARPPTLRFEYGISEIFDFEIEADAASQVPEVESAGWDVKQQQLTGAAKARPVASSQGNLDGKALGQALGAGPTVLRSATPLAPQELQAWADGTLARSRLALLRGRIGVPGVGSVRLLDSVHVAGIGRRYNGTALVTGVRHRVDQDGWRTDVQFGLSAERFAERPDIVDAPAAGLLPAVNGLQIGVVGAFEEDPEKELRVRVLLPGIDSKTGALWARLATPDAGNGRGAFFRPEPGDEVVVGFFNDDPRQAVILGALYGSKNAPPRSIGALTKENKKRAIVTRTGTTIGFVDDTKSAVFIETPDKRKIVLDDDAKAITIADQHGNTVTLDQSGIVIKSGKDVQIEASGNVTIKGQKVDVQ